MGNRNEAAASGAKASQAGRREVREDTGKRANVQTHYGCPPSAVAGAAAARHCWL
jgi:hypothetical protein